MATADGYLKKFFVLDSLIILKIKIAIKDVRSYVELTEITDQFSIASSSRANS